MGQLHFQCAHDAGDLGRCFFFPFELLGGRSTLQLRVAPSRNNQRLRVNWAEDFELGARLTALLGP